MAAGSASATDRPAEHHLSAEHHHASRHHAQHDRWVSHRSHFGSRTADPTSCAATTDTEGHLWRFADQPRIADVGRADAAVLGVRLSPEHAGTITGISFWKGAQNTGRHVGSLWSEGKQLATGTFTNESATGWQHLTFARPVTVRAGESLVAAYVAPHGHYAATPGFFARGARCTDSLQATGGFRMSHHDGHRGATAGTDTNYFVDVNYVTAGSASRGSSDRPNPAPQQPAPKPQPKPDPKPAPVKPTPKPAPKPDPKPAPQQPTPKPPAATNPEPGGDQPATTGWPNASNTGVPAGTKLTPHGSMDITKDGTVVSGLDVTGDITVRANNVVIEKTKVTGGRIDLGWSQHGVVIRDVEVDGQMKSPSDERVPAIGSNGYTCIRCNVHGWNSGFDVRDDVTITDSWAHDIGPANGVHKTALGSNGSNHVVVRHNVLSCEVSGCSAAIAFYGDFTPVNDITVDNNLFNTEGSYCSYEGTISGKKYPNATNVTWTNNHYGRKFHQTCGIYGPASGWGSGGGNVWSGNVWDDTNAAIPAG
ncbi:MAG TPA: DUF4082 domain-containing protein [Mycobacteriales bacterium]|nr:DUF4082 domain-containing protein [Mycobacteriales bacterium]